MLVIAKVLLLGLNVRDKIQWLVMERSAFSGTEWLSLLLSIEGYIIFIVIFDNFLFTLFLSLLFGLSMSVLRGVNSFN